LPAAHGGGGRHLAAGMTFRVMYHRGDARLFNSTCTHAALAEEVIVLVLPRFASPRHTALVGVALAVACGAVLAVPGRALAGPTYAFVATAHVSSTEPTSEHDALGCASANDCVVVGPDLAKSFDGQQATAISGLNGPGTLTAEGVDPNDWHAASCASDGACMIVSVDGLVAGHSAFRASATSPWTRVPMPIPQGEPSDGEWFVSQSVSCSSATFCLAAATFSNGADFPQVWRWDGTAWHLGNLNPSDPGHHTVDFRGVSCAAAWQCVVVGQRAVTTSGPALGEAVFRAVLDGNTWSVANLAVPSGDDGEADNVSCWSVQHCRIVGVVRHRGASSNSPTDVAVWKWSGGAFTTTTGFQASHSPAIESMSCTSATFCVAAGWEFNFATDQTSHLDLLWDGTSWTPLAIHRTALTGGGTVSTTTDGVACSAAYACRMVGDDSNGTARGTFLDSLQAT
jgi:hypothetical protein